MKKKRRTKKNGVYARENGSGGNDAQLKKLDNDRRRSQRESKYDSGG